MKPVLLLLLAVSTANAIVLTDDTYQLPAGEWRWVRFEIARRAATAECRFQTVGSGEARAEIVSRAELDQMRGRKQHDALASTDPERTGSLSQYIDEPGEYAVVIENAGDQTVAVHLNVALNFGGQRPVSRSLSPERRLTVILVSFAVFFAIITFSGRALLKAMKKTA